ncbi:uncharacterized protein LOC111541531 [Piliocolobus tephrosceles]|uniref:uncharacterized protein LOC111541531 n=1 Tax=Piliocolobus tephrosceles TaxID=591936 RepID=UPI000E6AFD65|nr:uncharacterized protein LOC111541531 [Piliocolobus tephrosceles]
MPSSRSDGLHLWPGELTWSSLCNSGFPAFGHSGLDLGLVLVGPAGAVDWGSTEIPRPVPGTGAHATMPRPTLHPLNAGRLLLLGGSSTVPILCPPLSRDTAHAPQSHAPLLTPPPGRRASAAAFPATSRCHHRGLRALVDSPGLRETGAGLG